jgi:SAM-dependent methyltransferase
MKDQDVEERLLYLYRKENPTFLGIENEDIRDKHFKSLKRLYRNLLKFPEKMFKDSNLLDVGSGTGETSLCYALWGANCDLVEFNDKACLRTKNLFDSFSIDSGKFRVFQKSLFDMDDIGLREKYDIVTSLGVIHHTANKEEAFRILANKVAKPGFLIVAVGNAIGGVQLHMMKWICRNYANSEEEMVEVAENLFSGFIDRSAEYGMRSRSQIIYDQIINDQHDYFFSSNLYNLACDNGLIPYTSYPAYHLPIGDSASNPTISSNEFSDALIMSDIIYGMHDKDDENTLIENRINERVHVLLEKVVGIIGGNMIGKKLNTREFDSNLRELFEVKDGVNFDYGYSSKFAKFLSEIRLIVSSLGSIDIVEMKNIISNFDIVFKGTEGLGIQYHVFTRDDGL